MQNVVALCIYVKASTILRGTVYDTVGIVPANCIMQQSCKSRGMLRLQLKARDTLLGAADTSLRGHEFHFSTMEPTVEGTSHGHST